jgi:CubicO group peptidase (beta-lactamase class C family)
MSLRSPTSARWRLAARRAALVALLLASVARAEPPPPAPLPAQRADVAYPTRGWPRGDPQRADHVQIEVALGKLFAKQSEAGVRDTRAVLVVQSGKLVIERYAPGFDAGTRFRAWSAGKSLANAWVALLVRDGRVSLDEPLDARVWRARADDPRRAITVRHALHMTTGLANADGDAGDTDSFIAQLLFGQASGDTALAAADVALTAPPGAHWAYSTGTTQLLAGLVADRAGEDWRAFTARELNEPLGLRSLVVEADRANTPLVGAFVWASAQDWARLGLLYLRDGVWEGRRILPRGWVDFTRTPADAADNGTYGAHFWVNATPRAGQHPLFAGRDFDSFEMNGSAGQFVVIVPGRDLVVVRLGEMHASTWPELRAALGDLIETFPARGAP